MLKLAAVCAEGLEDLLFDEILEYGHIINPEKYKGMLIFDFEGELKDLRKIKTAVDIQIFLKRFSGITRYKTSLRNIRQQCAKADIKSKLPLIESFRKINNTFSVKASYIGRRDYKAGEIEKTAQEGISKNSLVYKEDASLLLRLIIIPEISFLGLCLEDKPMDEKKAYVTTPGSLRPSVANTLLKLADVKEGDIVIDPMCGTGVIAIEASKIGNAIAGDIDKEKIKLAGQNAKSKNAKMQFHIWDARKTGLKDRSADAIVTNLPFEKKANIEGFNETFFDELIGEMIRITKDNARLVFLTGHSESLIKAAKSHNLEIVSVREIVNSGLKSTIVVLKNLTFFH